MGDGLHCAGGAIVRLELVRADAGGSSSTTIDIRAIAGLGGGEVRTYQLWYRDTAGSPCGSGFNLTNGLEIAWTP